MNYYSVDLFDPAESPWHSGSTFCSFCTWFCLETGNRRSRGNGSQEEWCWAKLPCAWKGGQESARNWEPGDAQRDPSDCFLSWCNFSHLSALPRNFKDVRLLYSCNIKQEGQTYFPQRQIIWLLLSAGSIFLLRNHSAEPTVSRWEPWAPML